MRKIAALILALMLLIPMVAMAEAEVEYTTYTNGTNGYSIDYPSDWTALNKESIDAMLELVNEGKIPGMDASTFEAYKQQVEALDMAMFIAADGTNVVATYADIGMEVTNEQFITLFCPTLIAQFEAVFTGMQTIDAGSEVTIGENNFVTATIAYEQNGSTIISSQLYYLSGTTMYTINFTIPNIAALENEAFDVMSDTIAASFTPAE